MPGTDRIAQHLARHAAKSTSIPTTPHLQLPASSGCGRHGLEQGCCLQHRLGGARDRQGTIDDLHLLPSYLFHHRTQRRKMGAAQHDDIDLLRQQRLQGRSDRLLHQRPIQLALLH